MLMSSRAHPPSRALLVGLCCLSGCFDDCDGSSYDPTPGPGELGNGDFHYYCTGADDPACPDDESSGPFPARFAVGGEFRLGYTWTDDASQPPPDLRTSAEDRLALVGEVFTPLVAGYTAVLALVGNSDVGDLIHVLAAEPTELAIQRDHIDLFELVLAIDEEATTRAISRDGDGYILAGTLTFAFEVDDPAIATIVGTTAGAAVLHGMAAGTTTLRASLGPLSAEIPVTVADVDVTTTDVATGGTESGSSGGTDTSGGSTGGEGSTGGSGSSGSSGGVL